MTSPASPAQPIGDGLLDALIFHHADKYRRNAGHDDELSKLNAEYSSNHLEVLNELKHLRQRSAEIARLAKDADRYRWLRAAIITPRKDSKYCAAYIEIGNEAFSEYDDEPNKLDAAIDAALAPASVTP